MKRLCVLLLAGALWPAYAGEIADLSREGVEIKVFAEPETVDVGRDFIVTVKVTSPAGQTVQLPDLRDRFNGFQVAEDFAEEPLEDEAGRTTLSTRWRLVPQPCARRYRLAPFVVALGKGTFYTAPVRFAPPAAREAASGEMEIDPRRDLPPLSWKLVGYAGAGLAALVLLGAGLWWLVRRLRLMVKIHRMSPLERARYELEQLLAKDLPGKGLHKDFYVELTQVVRRYIARRHGIKAPNLTTEEFFALTRASANFPQLTLEALMEFLRQADMVKFAGLESTPAMIAGSIESARTYLSQDNTATPSPR